MRPLLLAGGRDVVWNEIGKSDQPTETMDMRATCEPTAAGASALDALSSMIVPMSAMVSRN